MDAGIYSAVSGSLAAQTRLDVIANNLANASTPGFKAERFVQAAADATVGWQPAAVVETPITRYSLETDLSQGPIQSSGNPLDVALSGDGFLLVDTERGERLTRRGSLGIDGEGFLATSDGFRVQGDGGDLAIARGPVAIAPDGTIEADGQPVGRLRLVTVDDPGALVRESGTLFAAGTQTPVDAAPGSLRVIQGALEGANVSPIESLVALIETVRGFEAYMQAAERLDQVTSAAITEVGRV